MQAPSPPTPPDPIATSTAQGKADQQVATANTALGNANVYNALGSSVFNQTGTQTLTNPDGSVTTVPTYTNTQTLSPAEQKLFNQQTALGSQENTIAKGALNNVSGALQAGIQPSSFNPISNGSNVSTDGIQKNLGSTDYTAATQAAQQAAYARMQPALQQQHDALVSSLASQGISPGTEAYNRAMTLEGQQQNDAINQSILTGDQEQQQLYGEALSSGQFVNQAQNQGYNEQLGLDQFGNQATGQQVQQAIALQNQPINEVTALMSGGQVSMPQFGAYQGGTVAQTPLSADTYASANLAEQNYMGQVQQNSADLGAISGVAGAGLGALFRSPLVSDPKLKDDHGVVGKIGDIPLHEFNYKGDQTPLRGFMADEVKKVAPSAVKKMKGGFLAVDYAKALAHG